jgi:hypothetical protein
LCVIRREATWLAGEATGPLGGLAPAPVGASP